MTNIRTRSVSTVVLLSFALRCAVGFAVDPDTGQSHKKGENTVKSEAKPPELTRDYLLAHGFKQAPKDADSFTAEHLRLKDAARILGFEIHSLHRTVGQSFETDIRVGFAQGKRLVARSEKEDANGHIISLTAKHPDAICTVRISLKKYVPPRPPLTTDSNPRVTVKSIMVPKERRKPLRVTVEIAAEGKLPLGLLSLGQFRVRLTQGNSEVWETLAQPPDDFEDLLIEPGSPRILTLTAPDEGTLESEEWHGFHSGKYAVQVVIDGQSVLKGEAFDYSWVNGRPRRGCKVESRKFEFTVK